MHDYIDEEYLIGKKILDYKINEDNMDFITENEIISFYCDADCCSEGWIESVENKEYLKDCLILEVEKIPGIEIGSDDIRFSNKQDVDYIYFLKIKTEKGYVDIDFRNSSNGYYGTSLSWNKKDIFNEAI